MWRGSAEDIEEKAIGNETQRSSREADRGYKGVSCSGPRENGGPELGLYYIVSIGWGALSDDFVLGPTKAVISPE